jgi:hypothetical protein
VDAPKRDKRRIFDLQSFRRWWWRIPGRMRGRNDSLRTPMESMPGRMGRMFYKNYYKF